MTAPGAFGPDRSLFLELLGRALAVAIALFLILGLLPVLAQAAV